MSNVCDQCGKSNRPGAMFCIGCAGKLPGFVASGPSELERADAAPRRVVGEQLFVKKEPDDEPRFQLPVRSASFWLLMGLLVAALMIGLLTWRLHGTGRPGVGGGEVHTQATVRQPEIVQEPIVAPSAPVADAPLPSKSQPSPHETARDSKVETVESFYRALSAADGKAAAALVIPEKRGSGPYNETSITRFYGSFERPLVVRSIRPLDARRVEAKYTYRISRRTCEGTAIVETQRIQEQTFIRSIQANC